MKILAGGIVKRGWTVVSGMALSIDAIVHQAALEQGGKTIAVLGLEWTRFIPSITSALYEKIVETGAVISEMLPGHLFIPDYFPYATGLSAV
jgi:DNA processing protein